MTDIAALRYDVDSRQVTQASQALRGMEQAGRGAARGAADFGRATDMMEQHVRGLHAAVGQLRAAIGFIIGGRMVSGLMQTAMGLQRAQMTLQFVTGNAASAQKVFDDLFQTADRLGMGFEAVLPAFTSFAAAASQTGLSLESIQTTFTGVSAAMIAMGRNEQDAQRALTALQQILSKGKVQAEELTQQFAEALPGGTALAARAFGFAANETGKFLKILQDGKITARDFVETVGKYLNEQFGNAFADATGLASKQMAELENAWTKLKYTVINSGFMEALITTLNTLTAELQGADVQRLAREFGEILPEAARILLDALKLVIDNLDILQAIVVGWAAAKFLDFLVAGAAGLVQFFNILTKVHPLLGVVSFAIVGLIGLFEALGGGTDELTKAINGLREAQQRTLDQMPALAGASQDRILDALAEARATREVAKATLEAAAARYQAAQSDPETSLGAGSIYGEQVAELEAFIRTQDSAIRQLDEMAERAGRRGYVPPKPTGTSTVETDTAAAEKAMKAFQKAVEAANSSVDALFRARDVAVGRELAAQVALADGNRVALEGYDALIEAQEALYDYRDDPKVLAEVYAGLVERGLRPASMAFDDITRALAGVIEQTRNAEAATEKMVETLDNLPQDFSWVQAFNSAVDDYVGKAKSSAEAVQDAFSNIFAKAEDALTEFLLTGKLEAGDFLQYLARQVMQFVVQTIILAPLLEYFKSLLSDIMGGASAGVGLGEAILNFGFSLFSAKGHAFKDGRVLPFAKGGVVQAPTMFPMKDGTGLMGEKGPEAIMPLGRTATGELGIKAMLGAGGGGTINNIAITVNRNGKGRGDEDDDRALAEEIAKMVERRIDKRVDNRLMHHQRPGNMLNRSTLFAQR